MTASEIQSDKDQMRAEFAMSVRRLELSMEKLREKAMARLAPVHKRAAEVSRLQIELDEKAAQIKTLRARADVRKTVARRIVKLLLYIFARRRRRHRPVAPAPPLFKFEQGPQWEFKKQPAPRGHASAATALTAKTHTVQNDSAAAATASAAKTQPARSDLAATAAAIAAVNLKRRRAISNKV